MAVTIAERVESRETTNGESPNQTRIYVISGTESESEAMNQLLSEAPLYSSNGLPRSTATIEPIGDPTISLLWNGEVSYSTSGVAGSSNPPTTGSEYLGFDTGQSTIHITQSLETKQFATKYEFTTDRKRAINSSKEGTKGVDIIAPELRFSTTRYFAYDFVTTSYLRTVTNLAGHTNASRFSGFNVGEVLFLNASGSRRGSDKSSDGWEITFNFAVQLNIRAGDPKLTLAPGLTLTEDVAGWDYIWVAYESVVDESSGARTSVPFEAYVEKIYPEGDFEKLEI